MTCGFPFASSSLFTVCCITIVSLISVGLLCMLKESHWTWFCDEVAEIKLICLQRLDVVVSSLLMNGFDDINCLSTLQKKSRKAAKKPSVFNPLTLVGTNTRHLTI